MGNRAAFVVAFLLRAIFGGMQIVTKAAFDEGMSTSVFVFYRHLTGILFLVPIAFVLERKTAPPLSFKVSLKLFFHALYGFRNLKFWKLLSGTYAMTSFECTSFLIAGAINIYGLGLNYSSATSASAIFNILPAVAFFLAVLLGMETLNLKRFHGIAKASGVLFSIAGVIVLAFYQGPAFRSFIHHNPFHHTSNSHAGVSAHPKRVWIFGNFLTTLSTTSWALWTVLQGPMLEAYPSKLLNTTLQMIFATIQCFFIALAAERDFSKWQLALDIRLFAVLYSGILVSGVAYYMQVWVIEKSGPVFLAMTMPITSLVTIILSLFLGEAVTLGSILGGLIMVGGLYSVLWAKRSEQVDASKQQMAPAPAEPTQV